MKKKDDIMIDVSENIKNLIPYPPGKPIQELRRELGIEDIIKLASNENQIGPSPKAVSAIKDAVEDIYNYPEGSCHYLKTKITEKFDLHFNNIMVGNGSNEVIEIIMRTFLKPGEEVLTAKHSFIVYKLVTQAMAGKIVEVPMKEDLKFDIKALCQQINDKTKLIFVANPNNPTGTYNTDNEIKELIDYTKNKDVLVIFDQAYEEYVTAADWGNAEKYMKDNPHIMVTRTFSKIYGLAGTRCGYAIGHPQLIDYMNRVRQPFNVNTLAQVGATAALDDVKHIQNSIDVNEAGKKYLYKQFEQMSLKYWPSQGNFILFDTGKEAGAIYQAALKEGIIVRPVAGYGFPAHLRISIGTLEQNQKAMDILKKYIVK